MLCQDCEVDQKNYMRPLQKITCDRCNYTLHSCHSVSDKFVITFIYFFLKKKLFLSFIIVFVETCCFHTITDIVSLRSTWLLFSVLSLAHLRFIRVVAGEIQASGVADGGILPYRSPIGSPPISPLTQKSP